MKSILSNYELRCIAENYEYGNLVEFQKSVSNLNSYDLLELAGVMEQQYNKNIHKVIQILQKALTDEAR